MDDKIINNEKYWETYEIRDSNNIAKNIEKIIQEMYDYIAPVKKVKEREKVNVIKDKKNGRSY